MAGVTWVIDSSSLMDIKSRTTLEVRARLYARLTSLAVDGKIHVPREVIQEMKRALNRVTVMKHSTGCCHMSLRFAESSPPLRNFTQL